MPDQLVVLSEMQLERAKVLLRSVPVLIKIGDYDSAANRAYYAAFHAIKAVEALDNYDSKKHSGLLSRFRNEYIRTGIFDAKYSDVLSGLSHFRQDSDYNIFATISIEVAEEQMQNAADFVEQIEAYMKRRVRENGSAETV